MAILNKTSQFHHELHIDKDQKVFFVGDIHGCYKTLMEGLKRINFQHGKDVLVSTGDLVDRGNDCYKVVQFFKENPNVFSVLGNHDQFCLGRNYSHHINQGGKWFYFDTDADGKREIRDYFSSVPICLTVHIDGKKIAVTHAEIGTDSKNYYQFLESLDSEPFARECAMWDRYVINTGDGPLIEGVDWSVHGHSYTEEPCIINNRIYIDTGCIFSCEYSVEHLTFAEYKPSIGGFSFHMIENCE